MKCSKCGNEVDELAPKLFGGCIGGAIIGGLITGPSGVIAGGLLGAFIGIAVYRKWINI